MRIVYLLICFVFLVFYELTAQEAPFHKGVNLTNWFQSSSARRIQFTKYTKKDFEQIKSLGCDVIRLPINLHFMTNGAPDYQLDSLFLDFLDAAVDWAEALNLYLILDNHTFDPAANTDPNVGAILEKVWTQMAAHYRQRSKLILYEILNEPHGISDQQWNTIQQNVITAIRDIDTTHVIIVGPASWNSYHNLALMPQYNDHNLIYTFHFYDPFIFTHQGATWSDPSLEPLAHVPFPYQADRMPVLPASLRETWIESAFNNYQNDGTVQAVKALIDIAVQFKQSRNVPIFCGEFGVYTPNSDNSDRVFWYETVRKYLEEKGIAWTSWDYHGGFGLFKSGGNDLFDHDLNVPLLEALGMNVPSQTIFQAKPDTSGSSVYNDFIENGILDASYTNGVLDFYSKDQPEAGSHCIYWTGADQYNAISFDFKPDKDFSYLVNHQYALDFYVKGNNPGASFDIRFVDTKTNDPNDHPWRMGGTIDNGYVPLDNQWHHVHIPLSQFTEQGAWDNGWYNPQGKFDWRTVDRLEFVAEQSPLIGVKLWFDQIQITNETLTPVVNLMDDIEVKAYPNPTSGYLVLESNSSERLRYQIINNLGRKLQSNDFQIYTEVNLSGFSKGVYLIYLINENNNNKTIKVVKQ